jgi:preprotein translocase subunit SecY
MLGVGPYITSSIIMQLLTIMSPRFKAMYQEDGEVGRKKFTQLGRILTVPLAIVQGLSLIILLKRQGIIVDLTVLDMIANVSVLSLDLSLLCGLVN